MRWLTGLVFCAVSMLTGTLRGETDLYDTDATLRLMEKVCDWQLANLPEKSLVRDRMRTIVDNGWVRATFFDGVSDWEAYLAKYAQRVRSPLKVTLSQE